MHVCSYYYQTKSTNITTDSRKAAFYHVLAIVPFIWGLKASCTKYLLLEKVLAFLAETGQLPSSDYILLKYGQTAVTGKYWYCIKTS